MPNKFYIGDLVRLNKRYQKEFIGDYGNGDIGIIIKDTKKDNISSFVFPIYKIKWLKENSYNSYQLSNFLPLEAKLYLKKII